MTGGGSEYFHTLTATEFSTPLPTENAEESPPAPQGRKYFHVEFAVFVLSSCKFSFWLKSRRFFGWYCWNKLEGSNILHILYLKDEFIGVLGNWWVLKLVNPRGKRFKISLCNQPQWALGWGKDNGFTRGGLSLSSSLPLASYDPGQATPFF